MTDRLLTQPEIVQLMVSVGMSERNARVGSAIALCEAPATIGGVACSDFAAVGDQDLADDTWGYSYGGFQIRSLRAQKGTGGFRDEEQLVRPHFNARAAKEIRRVTGWKAWSTYTSGMYKAYLQDLYPPDPGTYIVLGGDTLSSIAVKLGGFTWQDLARINGIHEPYSIFIGQTLTLPT